MKDAASITSEVKGLETTVFHGLHQRMDKDFKRWNIERPSKQGSFEYMTHVQAKASDIQIVSNAPRTFSDSVQSTLSSSAMSVIVRMAQEGRDMREEIAQLERLLVYALEKADERLINRLEPTLKESSVWHSMVRGWLAGRFLVYKDGDEIIFDFLPYDPRWLVWQRGKNGLLSTSYTDFYSPEELEDEWGKDVGQKPWYKPWQKSKKSYEVIDRWEYEGKGKTLNAVVCGNEFLKEPETYDMKSFPVLISPVATRPPIKSQYGNEMGGYGESIFAPNRDIDDLLNACGSMWASHANLLYKQPIVNYYDEQGMKIPDSITYTSDMVFNLPMGHNRLEPSPMREISPTLVNLVNWLENMRVRGSMPDININSPVPQSGTLQSLILEESNKVFNPQIRNLNSFYSNICRLVEEQLLAGGVGKSKIKKINIRGIKDRDYYEFDLKPVDLKRPHIIKVEFTARNRWEQFETYQIADMAKRQGLPDAFINEYILKLPDPKGLRDLAITEMAEHSPKLAMLDAIRVLTSKQTPESLEKAQSLMGDMYNMWLQETANAEQSKQGMANETNRALSLPETTGAGVQPPAPPVSG